jgi:hypothetical protein
MKKNVAIPTAVLEFVVLHVIKLYVEAHIECHIPQIIQLVDCEASCSHGVLHFTLLQNMISANRMDAIHRREAFAHVRPTA